MDFIPEESAIDTSEVTVDSDTRDMLQKLNLNITVNVHDRSSRFPRGPRRDGRRGGDRRDNRPIGSGPRS